MDWEEVYDELMHLRERWRADAGLWPAKVILTILILLGLQPVTDLYVWLNRVNGMLGVVQLTIFLSSVAMVILADSAIVNAIYEVVIWIASEYCLAFLLDYLCVAVGVRSITLHPLGTISFIVSILVNYLYPEF